jgi:predicted TIM-barrel fold metal-dependent hydrolase
VSGAWDVDRRITEMDREGVAAEMIFPGDARFILPLVPMLRRYPQEVVAAGGRAYHRWLVDTFGAHPDRMLLVGDPGSGVDLDAMLAELRWIGEHGFVATQVPNVSGRGLPPLHDEYFDPYWSLCEELDITVALHAGYGSEQCEFIDKINEIKRNMEAAGRTDLLTELMNTEGFFALDYRPRKAIWQMMFGGVFDRHPNLRLYLAEIRGDWLPDTFRHLDSVYERERDNIPGQRSPGEYWRSNCMTSLSFVHKAEIEMRDEIGVDRIVFGRDFPHAEGTWPNTADWLTDAFRGVPDDELRLMLGENAIRFFGLDRAHLAEIASRIGPELSVITAPDAVVDPALVEHLQQRCGVLKPFEGDEMVRELDDLVADDLVILGAGR